MLRLSVQSGAGEGRVVELEGDLVRIGRAPSNELVLPDTHISGEHARIVVGPTEIVLEDLRSTNGTFVVRGPVRIPVDDGSEHRVVLCDGDRIELGQPEQHTAICVVIREDADATQVVTVRSIDDVSRLSAEVQEDPRSLSALYKAQLRIGAATELDDTLGAIADAVFALVPRATHVTLALREGEGATAAPYVPVMTRLRGPAGTSTIPREPVPVTRSIFRKVIEERAAVLAADAPRDVGATESLMGASIRSTIGVPLWKGEDILGVLQVDNRDAPAMLKQEDVEILTVLSGNASLALASARLIRRLRVAEERLSKENRYLKSREESRRTDDQILGKSQAMARLLEQLRKVADTRVTVLIEGETGTGKELIASAVHYKSRRRDKLFVTQNCAALPENLLESELFGHKRGAFTGASEEKKGLFEIADGGTLFLDELGEMPLLLQSKLLRALQEGEIRPVGATQSRTVDVRIVAATNRNLEDQVKQGKFREDLYYRLKVFPLRVPPLRERREDIALLANAFLSRYATEIGKPVTGFSQQALELMAAYEWPGNVRELQNEVQRLVIDIEPNAIVTPELLSRRIRTVQAVIEKAGGTKGSLKEMMDSVEKYILLDVLGKHAHNKTASAKALGITREGLHKKLRQFGIG